MTGCSSTTTAPRRVLATRNRSWARSLAAWLAARGVRPNAVSVWSMVFASLAAIAFALVPGGSLHSQASWLVAAAVCIQLRLLCNMLDGMLAVEGGLKSKTGDIFNELPDRFADVVIFVAAGYAVRDLTVGPVLGWLAALLAVLTAYVRAFSGSLGLPQHFLGPMAKQHRMFLLTVACLAGAAEAWLSQPARALAAGLGLIVLGTFITLGRRTVRLVREASAR